MAIPLALLLTLSGSYRGGAFCLGRGWGCCLPWHHRGGAWDLSGRILYRLACALGDLQQMCVTRDEARVKSFLGALSSHMPHALTASLFQRAAAVPIQSSGSTRALGPRPLTKSPLRQMSSIPLGPLQVSTTGRSSSPPHAFLLRLLSMKFKTEPKKCRSVFSTVPHRPKSQPFPLTF